MNQKYDLLRAVGHGIRELMPSSPPSTDLQVLLLRLAMQEAERAHYGGILEEFRRSSGVSARS